MRWTARTIIGVVTLVVAVLVLVASLLTRDWRPVPGAVLFLGIAAFCLYPSWKARRSVANDVAERLAGRRESERQDPPKSPRGY